MQDSYTGDVGDYIKLALLRALTGSDYRLGIGWYKMPDEPSKNDGRHVRYLGLEKGGRPLDVASSAAKWRGFDPPLYDGLRDIVSRRSRKVDELAALLPAGTVLHDVPVARHGREQWFNAMLESLSGCNLLFVDPDNGIAPSGYKAGSARSGKSVTLDEIWRLRSSIQNLVLYHHHTRFAGGHYKEIDAIGAALQKRDVGCIAAVRAKSFSPRVFFLLGFDQELWRRAVKFSDRWGDKLEFISIDGPPDTLNLPPSSPYGDGAERSLIEFDRRIDAGDFDEFLSSDGRNATA